MDFPKFDSFESILTFSLSIIVTISVYLKNTPTIEYLYFYLCNLRLLFVILTAILLIIKALRLGTGRIPFIFLGIILLNTLFSIGVWYYSLSFETVIILFYGMLSLFILLFIISVILVELGIFLSTYHGMSTFILYFKNIYNSFIDPDSPERYRSLTYWNLQYNENTRYKTCIEHCLLDNHIF